MKYSILLIIVDSSKATDVHDNTAADVHAKARREFGDSLRRQKWWRFASTNYHVVQGTS